MDPNTALERIRALSREIKKSDPDNELVATFDDLDKWLVSGGFVPEAWARTRPTR